MQGMSVRAGVVLLLIGLACLPATAAPITYTLVDLGAANAVPPYARVLINNRGTVVFSGAGPVSYIWRNGLRTPVANVSYAMAMNNEDDLVGLVIRQDGSRYSAVVRDGIVEVLAVPAGYSGGSPSCINDSGTVAGSMLNSAGTRTVAVWTDGTTVDLGGSDTNSYARAINNLGRVAGYAMPSATRPELPLISEEGEMTVMSMLEPRAIPADINDLGQVVGDWDDCRSQQYGFVWQNGAATLLPNLSTRTDGRAYGVNNGGVVVGACYTPSANSLLTSSAVLWIGGSAYDLNSLTEVAAGCILSQAWDINDDGWIAADGYLNGERHVFVLRPVPEPCTVVTLLCGMGAVVFRRRR